jgi:hypothetical protein
MTTIMLRTTAEEGLEMTSPTAEAKNIRNTVH